MVDVFSTIDMSGTNYKITNQTDYSIDRTYLDSDSGFIVDYKRQKGTNEYHWLNTLRRLGFGPAFNMRRYLERESSIEQINFQELHHGKVYVLNFVFGRTWYGFAFDGKEFILQYNDGNLYLPTVIF